MPLLLDARIKRAYNSVGKLRLGGFLMKQQNSMLKTARLQKSWTPEFVSKKVGVSLSTYIRWESGIQTPRNSSLYALCQVFEMSPAELGFEMVPPPPPKRSLDPILSKKDFAANPDSDALIVDTGNLAETLALWKMGISSCWQLYMIGGQTELERLLPAYLSNLARPTLYPGPEQKMAAHLTAQVYQLTALLELQRGDFVTAQMNASQALVYSQIAKDWNLYIASQMRLASIFIARKRIGSALSAYNDALRRVNSSNDEISPLLHCWIFAALAEIQATMGREKEALQFLQLAFAVFPDDPMNDPSFSYIRYERYMLFLYEGQVFLRLGQPKTAWDAFSRIDELKPAPPERIRAEFLKQRAYTSLVLGNMVQSCIYLEAAAKAAQEIHSDLAFSEIYTLYEHMLAVWGQEVRVRSLSRLFQH
jgi:transcriptional regulator with XRE-family HTH domain